MKYTFSRGRFVEESRRSTRGKGCVALQEEWKYRESRIGTVVKFDAWETG